MPTDHKVGSNMNVSLLSVVGHGGMGKTTLAQLVCNNKTVQDSFDLNSKIMSILMLSYRHLPLHLRPCFAFCGMFPKDHEFCKEDLVLMWMAVGLVQHSHQSQGEMLEDTGGYYFDELLRRSLFDHNKYSGNYVMHDLLHDLTQFASHGECYSFVGNDKKVDDAIPNIIRHLYIESDNLNVLLKMDNWHNLCSLVLIIKDARSKHFSALKEVLRSLKSIRMLHLFLGKVIMPDAFSHLIHLRSLKIYGILKQFPKSVCNLYHLQVLKFYYAKGTIKLLESMNKLVNLRYLTANDQVAGVGKLIFLQELDFSIRKDRGYKIGELGDLVWLCTLSVGGLENVDNQEEASMAKLSNKRYLQRLHLAWSASSDPGMDRHKFVFDRLQPHANLKKLMIEGYRGIRYANWMRFEQINNLQYICLSNCSTLDHLPPLERLPFLKGFELNNMPAIRKLDYQCQHLKNLHIYYMEGLVELSGPGADTGQWHPYLQTLQIRKCPKLEVLPSLSLSIRGIYLDNLGLVSLPKLWLDHNGTCSTSGSSSSSLQVLVIKNCGKITSLGIGLLQLQHYLTTLERLEIWNCAELVDFPSEGIQHLRALKYLCIVNCPKLRVSPDPVTPQNGNDDKFHPSSLEKLEIRGVCAELVRSMPTLLKGIISLGELRLTCCEVLMSLEGLMGLQTVNRLEIDDPILLVLGALGSLTLVRHLTILKCGQLESVNGELEQWFLKNQSTLKRILIHEAPSLKSLPGCLKNLSSLESLVIYCANETLKERCWKDKGADWPTISHIRQIEIRSASS